MTPTGYAFRDTAEAAGRLGIVARLFDPTTAAFLRACAPAGPGLAYDLGCGPGFTTRLLAQTVAPSRVVGLDESENFVQLARKESPDLAFARHDVTAAGFPVGAADLLFCRMLLTHLADPVAALEGWSRELRPGGLLLVDEVEAIATGDQVFTRYLKIAASLIAGRGGRLYVGPELEAARPAGLERLESRASRLAPEPAQVAAMFRLNLGVWRDSPELAGISAELDALDDELRRRAGGGDVGPITWTMRQIAYRRGST